VATPSAKVGVVAPAAKPPSVGFAGATRRPVAALRGAQQRLCRLRRNGKRPGRFQPGRLRDDRSSAPKIVSAHTPF